MLMKAGLLTADHRGPKIAKGPTDPLFPVIGLQILRASDPGLPTPNYPREARAPHEGWGARVRVRRGRRERRMRERREAMCSRGPIRDPEPTTRR